MIVFFDLALLIATAAVLGMKVPAFGVFLVLLGLFYGAQFWKTLLLLGTRPRGASRLKMVQSAFLALILSVSVGLSLIGPEPEKKVDLSPEDLWNGPLLPVYLGMALVVALALIALITERRKR